MSLEINTVLGMWKQGQSKTTEIVLQTSNFQFHLSPLI